MHCPTAAHRCQFSPLGSALFLLCLMLPASLLSQTISGTIQDSSGAVIAGARIEITGGDSDKPIENASVYVKYIEERKLMKDKKLELNVKTNRDGAAHIPAAPMGRVLIQVVADGWKTYGRWYDITDLKQTFKIHLEKPPKWY